MVAAIQQQDSELTELAQLEALERMLGATCDYLTDLVDQKLARKDLESREARFQLEAFEERRNRALKSLQDQRDGPLQVRIGNLHRLVEALECSWVYFNGLAEAAGIFEDSSDWAVCLK